MKVHFEKLIEINNLFNELDINDTKLEYCFKKFLKSINQLFFEYNGELQDIRINNALVDTNNGAILYAENKKDFLYSKEGLKQVLKEIQAFNKMYFEKEFEVEPCVCKDLQGITLNEEQVELLKGLII